MDDEELVSSRNVVGGLATVRGYVGNLRVTIRRVLVEDAEALDAANVDAF